MIVKGALILFMLLFLTVNAKTQHLSHQVLVPAAGLVSDFGINYSQTMGETAVEIIESYDWILTQGFQQPPIKIAIDTPKPGTGVEVYPNPVVDYVKVELFGKEGRDFSIMIININGSTVYFERLRFENDYWHIQEIPVSGFTRGLYFIRVMSSDGYINRTFKMEKM